MFPPLLRSYPRARLKSPWRNAGHRSHLPIALPQVRNAMRLIKNDGDQNLVLVQYDDDEIPQYAILSHTWGADCEEVTYKDLVEGTGKNKAGYRKIDFCVKQTATHGLRHFWVDTCCIDKSSSAELTEAINSMFHWYRNADRCYVYLSDVSTQGANARLSQKSWEAAFPKSRWFSRGWTLQELIAPSSVAFFSKEGDFLGNKRSLESHIHTITGIAIEALRGGKRLADFTVKERLAWASYRKTKRPEDKAYSLLGLFNIYMPLLYGEGEDNAFLRLRQEINKSSGVPKGAPEMLLSPSSMVPFRPDDDFVDRRAEHSCGTLLEQIEQSCRAAASRVALVGIGGSGKSQLAIEYCHRLHERSPDIWIFWIHASNAERVEQGYREIAEQVKIPGRKNPQNNIFELVTRWLRDKKKERWLLVLDNVDDDVMLSTPLVSIPKEMRSGEVGQLQRPLSAYLPQSSNGTLLVTTRARSVASKLVEPRDMIMIGPMAQVDAVALLKKKLGAVDVVDDDLEELANVLEYMPLALVQAAAFIQQKGPRYRVRQYIDEFQRSDKRKLSLLDYEAGYLRRDSEAKNSIVTTWQISFDYIREQWPSAANLLALMSFFDRQGIPKEVLTVRTMKERRDGENRAGEEVNNEDSLTQQDGISDYSGDEESGRFEEDIDRLHEYSFVFTGVDGQTFEMHELVQLGTRRWLAMQGEDEWWRGEFCRKLNAVFPTGRHENWPQCERLFPHAMAAERQRPASDAYIREWGRILRNAGWYALAKGQYKEAEKLCDKSAQALKRVLGSDDVDTLTSMNNLALTYQSQGRWKVAEELLLQVVEARTRVLGAEHPNTLTSMNNLASTYQNQGRWKEAEELLVQVIERSTRVLGVEHPDTLTSIDNLASTYRNQGQWKEAEELEVQVIETKTRVLGTEHPDTLASINNLASTYGNQGRWKEAEELEVQVTETSTSVLGAEHPDTLTSINNLALIYENQGRWKEAEDLLIQVIEMMTRVLGAEHPDTLASINNLALTFYNQGRWKEAEELLMQVKEISTRVLGAEYPSTLASKNNLASTYRNQGRWKEAEELEVQVIETKASVLGAEHHDTLASKNNLALTYQNQGRWKEAEDLLLQVTETSTKVLGAEHPSTLTSMNNLALTYRNQGQWKEAEELLMQVMETSTRVLGAEHPSTLTCMNNVASTYRNQGQWKEAEELEVQVMETKSRVLGAEHPDTLTSMNNLAFSMKVQGRNMEATALMSECVQLRNRILGAEHPDTLSSLKVLAKWQAVEQ